MHELTQVNWSLYRLWKLLFPYVVTSIFLSNRVFFRFDLPSKFGSTQEARPRLLEWCTPRFDLKYPNNMNIISSVLLHNQPIMNDEWLLWVSHDSLLSTTPTHAQHSISKNWHWQPPNSSHGKRERIWVKCYVSFSNTNCTKFNSCKDRLDLYM